MAANDSRRFGDTSADEIEHNRLRRNLENIRSNWKCANILRDSVRLNEMLAHFYVDVRKPDGGIYKATSFESIRIGFNRYLKSPPPHNKEYILWKIHASPMQIQISGRRWQE